MNKLENEMKMAVNKPNLEKDEAGMLEVQRMWKQQKELGLRMKRRLIESPTQSPFPRSPENTSEKIIPFTIMSNHSSCRII